MIKKKIKIFICATEQSGDNIGYNIIKELLKKNKNNELIFDGVGGSKMGHFFRNNFYTLNNFNSMGIFEIIFSLKKYLKMINFLVNKIFQNKYDLIITIDSPDFNYPLVKKLRKNNYKDKVIHIVAPTVWAWRKNRAKKFSDVFDELLVLFKFEIKYFQKFSLKTSFIGHPIFYINKNKYNNLSNQIAFLPGSRKSELKKLLPFFELAYQYLLKNNPNFTIFIPTLPHLKDIIKTFVSNWKMKVIISTDINNIEDNYTKTSKALVCSGTASLEIAKRNIPQLIIYKFNFLTVFIGKMIIKIKYANIINIIENKMIIPEVVNNNLNNNSFISAFNKLINDNESNYNQINEINKVLNKLHSSDPPYVLASERIIKYLANFSKAN